MTLLAGFQLERILTAAVAVAVVGLAQPAAAQQYPLRAPDAAAKRPQLATSAPERVRPEPAPGIIGPAFPIGVTLVPAILMSDGTVWANFGNGFVQVRTACRSPRGIDSRGLSTPQRRERHETPCFTRNSMGSLVVTR